MSRCDKKNKKNARDSSQRDKILWADQNNLRENCDACGQDASNCKKPAIIHNSYMVAACFHDKKVLKIHTFMKYYALMNVIKAK